MHDDDGEWRMVFCFCLRTKTDDSSELKPRQGLGLAARLVQAAARAATTRPGRHARPHPSGQERSVPAGCVVAADSEVQPNILKLSDRRLCGRSQVASARLAHQCKCWQPSKHGTRLYEVQLHWKQHLLNAASNLSLRQTNCYKAQIQNAS